MVDILKNAATYEGGLDRGNIMLAARNIHETNPLLIHGLHDRSSTAPRTPTSSRVARWSSTRSPTRPSSARSQPDGDLIDLEGQLGTYATVTKALRLDERRHHHEHRLISDIAGTLGGRPSGGPLRVRPQTFELRPAQNGARRSRLRILPEPVLGSSSLQLIERGIL